MPLTRSRLIDRGERAPDFALLRGRGGVVRFYGVVGGTPAVLVLAGALATDELEDLEQRLTAATAPGAVHLVATGEVVLDSDVDHEGRGVIDPDAGPSEGVFHDHEGKVHDAYGIGPDDGPIALVLSPSTRVVAAHHLGNEGATDAVARAFEGARHPASTATLTRHAPVLLVPDVLDEEWRTRLVDVWSSSPAAETGVETTTDAGRGEVSDHLRKRRRDHVVEDQVLLRELTDAVGRRLMPEVQQAFAYRATRFEGFKIGCYEADTRGFFEAHRDNLSPATAHRRFALTLNLNDEYDGGELVFPEYGTERYRPHPGTALVFSGSLLHEVRPVTRGRRFVLLSFLFDRPRRAASHDHAHDH